ncbi:hypothetical protein [Thalassospira sp. TSL5-1]|uniref:hypothetical protein n=1 Tax=Thalassospira sp. TSL5-1 TaxID=1544451 RepID=UPI000A7C6B2D|nr:hypothetical protein [Thalassospira sp. TSL5-1]
MAVGSDTVISKLLLNGFELRKEDKESFFFVKPGHPFPICVNHPVSEVTKTALAEYEKAAGISFS